MSSDLNQLDLPADLPSLPDGWGWTVLSRLVDPDRGICYGIVQPGKHHFDGVPMVNTGDVLDGRVNLDIAFRVEKKLHDQFRRSTLRGGEVLVTLVGANFGRVAIAPPEFCGHNCSRAVGVVPLKENSEFVMFALRSPIARHFFDTWANTTAQPTFNLKDLGKLPVPVPPGEAAKQISILLMSLDDRITLLRETNATLEAIAQALFKSWFVDFDPVRAKAEGLEPESMDAATAALFPDGFEETERGVVPRGWSTGVLSDICIITSGKRPPDRSDTISDICSIPLFGGAGLMGYTSDVLFSTAKIVTGRVGTLGKVHIAYPPFWASDNVLVLSPKLANNFSFCLNWLKSIDVVSLNRGSTQPLLTQKDLGSQQGVIPSEEILKTYEGIVGVFYDQIRSHALQAQTLTELRDTLLPRLISGQLRLPETEVLVEEVCA